MKLFRRKSKPKPIPTPHKEPDRYKGRPLFIFLENYVLDCIGKLPLDKQESAAELVKTAFGGDDDWKQTIRRELGFSDSIDDDIRRLWKRNQQIAQEASTTLHPVQFAKMIVDQNFAHLVE